MTICDVLAGDQEKMPEWLGNAPRLDSEIARKFLASRLVFYPGAGHDLHTIEIFGRTHNAHCFIHADFGDQIQPGEFDGYAIVVRQPLNYTALVDLFGMDARHPYPERWEGSATAEAIENGQSWWVVYQRSRDGGDGANPRCFALLHANAEAVWLYSNLWARHRAAPHAALLQDHGFGGNWTTFGGPTDSVHAAALFEVSVRAGAFPRWLLVGDGTRFWPGYELARKDAVEGAHVGAMWDGQRKLYGRSSL